jgi:hypothetical protein
VRVRSPARCGKCCFGVVASAGPTDRIPLRSGEKVSTCEDSASGRAENSRSFSQKIHNVNFFVKKKKEVPCCRRRNQLPGLVCSRNSSYCVTPVMDRTYAVGSKSGVHLDERPDSPPAGRNGICFFTEILHKVQNFCEKEKRSTMLPQAKRAFTGCFTRFDEPPRNSGNGGNCLLQKSGYGCTMDVQALCKRCKDISAPCATFRAASTYDERAEQGMCCLPKLELMLIPTTRKGGICDYQLVPAQQGR